MIYEAFGLSFQSELEIPEFCPTTEQAAVTLRFAQLPASLSKPFEQGFHYQISKNEFLLCAESVADFYVSNGTHINIEMIPGTDERDVRSYLLSPVVGILLHQRGLLPMHAAAVIRNNQLVLIAGASGAGKSTLLAQLCLNHDFSYLSDDITALDFSVFPPLALPSFPHIKLWDDSLAMMQMEKEEFPYIRKNVFKRRVDFRNYYHNQPDTPCLMVILSPDSDGQSEPKRLTGTEKFTALNRQIFLKKMTAHIYPDRQFQNIVSLASQLECFECKRPATDNAVNKLASTIETLLGI